MHSVDHGRYVHLCLEPEQQTSPRDVILRAEENETSRLSDESLVVARHLIQQPRSACYAMLA